MKKHRFKIGDRVWHDGLLASVTDVNGRRIGITYDDVPKAESGRMQFGQYAFVDYTDLRTVS